ncbi:fatty acyl-AMP ligase [Streptomyces niveus]|uniref:fatty acyl-AMP ligase n=1 Tax=Streptomyces niveus TaxID=193462 RepID=UPI00363CA0A3
MPHDTRHLPDTRELPDPHQLPDPREVPTLAHALAAHAAAMPDRAAVTYRGSTGEPRTHTYAGLHLRASALGAALAPLPGDGHDRPFVLIALPNGLDYVASFFACLMADAVAVTFHPPALSTARAGDKYDQRALAILQDCRPAAVLAECALHERLRTLAERAGLRPPLLLDPATYGTERSPAGAASPPAPLPAPLGRPESLALLQYTSGSTSEPKGVMVSHANLVHNSAGLARNLGSGPGQTAVGWLPLFHDMGLIGMICHPLWAGMSVRMSTPAAFLRDPASWLHEISQSRATITIAPDFGYATAARKVAEKRRAGLDLSCLRHALSGAEPVRPRTIEDFTEAYAPWGLEPRAMMPVYGLAEATLCVSCVDRQAEPALTEASQQALREGRVSSSGKHGAAETGGDRALTLVGCGRSFTDDTEVAVVDPDAHVHLPDGEVGEIWVSGPSVAGGYWNRPGSTDATFGATVQGSDRRYLRTGDLGVMHGGQLHIVGRRKDVIVHNGVNHHPQDLEATVETAHAAVGRVAAVGVPVDGVVGAEELVLLVELADYGRDRDHDAVLTAVRRAVTESHGIAVRAVELLKPGAVPRTTSGKVRRREAARRWATAGFNPLAGWPGSAAAPRSPRQTQPGTQPQNQPQSQALEKGHV